MWDRLRRGLSIRRALLIAAATGATVYLLMPSCTAFVPDADDTICHAIDAAEGGEVLWPQNTHTMWASGRYHQCEVFDHLSQSWWTGSEEAREYIEGYGLARGHGWAELGRDDVGGEVFRPEAAPVREADPEEGAVLVLALVHHEDAVGPEQEIPGDGNGGERRHRLDQGEVDPQLCRLQRRRPFQGMVEF